MTSYTSAFDTNTTKHETQTQYSIIKMQKSIYNPLYFTFTKAPKFKVTHSPAWYLEQNSIVVVYVAVPLFIRWITFRKIRAYRTPATESRINSLSQVK